MKKILFVCTGNICRSPTAEGVLKKRLQDAAHLSIHVDSAGTHAYHVGEPPDPRAVNVAKKRGILIDGLIARKLSPQDFNEFDLILALDYEHLQFLRRMAPANSKAEVALFLEYAEATREKEVPDPYYGSSNDFEYVLDLIESGSDGLLKKIAATA